jgi:hypothetical protein
MLEGLLSGDSWWSFLYHWGVPLYTWYYITSFVLLAYPFLRLLFGLLKYAILGVCTLFEEIVCILDYAYAAEPDHFTFKPQRKERKKMRTRDGQKRKKKKRVTFDESSFSSSSFPASADQVVRSLQRNLGKAQWYCVVLAACAIAGFLVSGFVFTFYDKMCEGYDNQKMHQMTVQECAHTRFSSAHHRQTCEDSKKELQKSVVFYALRHTVLYIDQSVWYIFYSPIAWLCMFVVAIYVIAKVVAFYVGFKDRHGNSRFPRRPLHQQSIAVPHDEHTTQRRRKKKMIHKMENTNAPGGWENEEEEEWGEEEERGPNDVYLLGKPLDYEIKFG